ncbi:MAG: mechanosensitive ion channel family protein [Lentisphaeria bacterium]
MTTSPRFTAGPGWRAPAASLLALALATLPAMAQETPLATNAPAPVPAPVGQAFSLWIGNWVQSAGFQMEWFGLEAWRLLAALLVLLLAFCASLLARRLLLLIFGRLIDGNAHPVRKLMLDSAVRPAAMLILAAGVQAAAVPLLEVMPHWFGLAALKSGLLLSILAVVLYFYKMAAVVDLKLAEIGQRGGHQMDPGLLAVLRKSLRILVAVVSALFIGQAVFNLNITALLASAGIAGLAIALAAQDTVANLFGSFVLLLDRPFKVGDRVVVGGVDGTVESIGLRSSRIRTLQGHLVAMPNKSLTEVTVENITRRPYLQRKGNLTLTYDTPPEKVEQAIQILRDILRDHPHQRPELPPRVVFNEFSDSSLNILYIAWLHTDDWWAFQDWIQETNLKILRAFAAAGIEFAFPTRTAYLAGDPRRPLEITLKPPATTATPPPTRTGDGAATCPGPREK